MPIARLHIQSSCLMLLLVALLSYDVLSYFPDVVSDALLKIVYYGVIVVLFSWLFYQDMRQHGLKRHTWDSDGICLTVFVVAFSFRIFYDLFIVGVPQQITVHTFTILFLFLNAAILPVFFFQHIDLSKVNLTKLSIYTYCVFVGMGCISMWYVYTGQAEEYTYSDGRLMGNDQMDTIAFGHLGTTLALLSVALFREREKSKWFWLMALVGVVFGSVIAFLSGSRGAVLALAVCLFVWGVTSKYKKIVALGVPVLLALIVAIFPILNDFLLEQGSTALDRLYNSIFYRETLTDNVTSFRDILYAEAWEHIVDSPLLGHSFLLNEGIYVHNIAIEAVMATGLIVGGLFVWVLLKGCIYAIRLLLKSERYTFIGLLFIQYVMYGMFSRSLVVLPLFWISLCLILSFYHQQKS